MIQIDHTNWVYLKDNTNLVMVRTRWNHKKTSVKISTGCNVDITRWDDRDHRAKYNTTHNINGRTFTAKQINNRITQVLEIIEDAFGEFSLKEKIPTSAEMKEVLEEKLGRFAPTLQPTSEGKPRRSKSLKEIYDEFIRVNRVERNWNENDIPKYEQMWSHMMACDPKMTLAKINKAKMIELRDWYVNNGYRNRTAAKQLKYVKSFLSWVRNVGYPVDPEAVNFKPNLKVVPKTVTYLNSKELDLLTHFKFPDDRPDLDLARDLWVFMANTSLRISDLKQLNHAHIVGGSKIEMYTEKTDDRITVPLTDEAKRILFKYEREGENPKSTVFPRMADQTLNDLIKEAATIVNLDREVIDVYFQGTTRHEEIHKICEVISCHMARRTFVVCSLSMGIPAEVVMMATGHSDYESMKPYIDIADETQAIHMTKWNRNQYKSQIVTMIDDLDKEQLQKVVEFIKELI